MGLIFLTHIILSIWILPDGHPSKYNRSLDLRKSTQPLLVNCTYVCTVFYCIAVRFICTMPQTIHRILHGVISYHIQSLYCSYQWMKLYIWLCVAVMAISLCIVNLHCWTFKCIQGTNYTLISKPLDRFKPLGPI